MITLTRPSSEMQRTKGEATKGGATKGGETKGGETTISHLINRAAQSVDVGLSVDALGAYFLERDVGAVAVTSHGKLVGVASTADLLRAHYGSADDASPRRPDDVAGFHATRIVHSTVRDVMTSFAFALRTEATIEQAAALMVYEGVHQIPVLDAGDRFIGMISSLDVMGWLAHRDTPAPHDEEDDHDGFTEIRRLRGPVKAIT